LASAYLLPLVVASVLSVKDLYFPLWYDHFLAIFEILKS
jgi:hypothetical protein